jgi:uncharacterized protein with HEPN domain
MLARAFIAGMSFADFQQDRKTVLATIRCLEVVSEAARKLPSELCARHSAVQWHAILAAGNVYRHGYRSITDDRVWATIAVAGGLLAAVEKELAEVSPSDPGTQPDGSP